MGRKVFFSFHYAVDAWRAAQVRNAGVVEGDEPVSPNDWEEVKRGGDAAVRNWINAEMKGKSCLVVLIGASTAGRKWIDYEIGHAWNEGKGVVGVHIDKLKDQWGQQSQQGADPFATFKMKRDGSSLSSIVKRYGFRSSVSTEVHAAIKANLAAWVDEAIKIRTDYEK